MLLMKSWGSRLALISHEGKLPAMGEDEGGSAVTSSADRKDGLHWKMACHCIL